MKLCEALLNEVVEREEPCDSCDNNGGNEDSSEDSGGKRCKKCDERRGKKKLRRSHALQRLKVQQEVAGKCGMKGGVAPVVIA